MQSIQTRSQKSKAAPKMAGRGLAIAPGSTRGNSDVPSRSGPALSAQEREKFVAQAAYYRAEKRGFAPGFELQDWVEAEAEVLRLIGGA